MEEKGLLTDRIHTLTTPERRASRRILKEKNVTRKILRVFPIFKVMRLRP